MLDCLVPAYEEKAQLRRENEALKRRVAELEEKAAFGAHDFEVLLGERMYIDSSMQYRNGTVNLTIKRKPREAAEIVEGASR